MSTPRRTPIKGANKTPNSQRNNNARNSPRPPRTNTPNGQILSPPKTQKSGRQRPISHQVSQSSEPEPSVLFESSVTSESSVFQSSNPQQGPPPSSATTMSPTARYHSNLKVLRRRDPSIVSIFDQFPHVCAYRHDGTQWLRLGYEGTMFLYERDSYPPYGFFILNRVGPEDYVARIYPENVVGGSGGALCLMRSYPAFTARRLTEINAQHPGEALDKFSDVYALPDIEAVKNMDKGESFLVGLWVHPDNFQVHLTDSMLRLHSYIQKNLPYPENFKYGPDRPPPIVNLRQPVFSPDGLASQGNEEPYQSQAGFSNASESAGGASELDQLFAKFNLGGQASSSSSEPQITIDSLFANLGGNQPPQTSPAPVPAPVSSPGTGLSLLDSIFASAGPRQAQPPPQPQPQPPPQTNGVTHLTIPSLTHPMSLSSQHAHAPPEPEAIIIYSPTPTTNALPQILNQDVISNLLGLPGSRASSAAPTTTSRSTTSTSREGGDEYGGSGSAAGSSDGGHSQANTVLETDASEEGVKRHAIDGQMTAGRLFASLLSGTPSDDGNVHGDVTPRAPGLVNGHASARENAPALQASASTSTLRAFVEAQPAPAPQSNSARALVPFQTDSELWPYPRAPLDDRDAREDIVELDFADTSALSDPAKFDFKVSQGRSAPQKNGRIAHTGATSEGYSGASLGASEEDIDGLHKKARKRMGKKERNGDCERIEQRWDMPEVVQRQPHLRAAGVSSSPSPMPSLPPSVLQAGGKTDGLVNGAAKSAALDKDTSLEALVGVVGKMGVASKTNSQKLDKKEFVMEILTLIHRDKDFVDSLYQAYLSRF